VRLSRGKRLSCITLCMLRVKCDWHNVNSKVLCIHFMQALDFLVSFHKYLLDASTPQVPRNVKIIMLSFSSWIQQRLLDADLSCQTL
jgi:hypothetical protein